MCVLVLYCPFCYNLRGEHLQEEEFKVRDAKALTAGFCVQLWWDRAVRAALFHHIQSPSSAGASYCLVGFSDWIKGSLYVVYIHISLSPLMIWSRADSLGFLCWDVQISTSDPSPSTPVQCSWIDCNCASLRTEKSECVCPVTMAWLLWIILRTYCQHISVLGLLPQVENKINKKCSCQQRIWIILSDWDIVSGQTMAGLTC